MRNKLLLNFNTLKNNYNELRSLCNSYEQELRYLRNIVKIINDEIETKPQEKQNKATKGDILGLSDYVEETIDSYESSGRPYDDDELLDNRQWAQRCVDWLKQQAKEMS